MWRARGSPPRSRHLGPPRSHPGSALAPTTTGLRGALAAPAPVRNPGCGFPGGRGDTRPPTPHTLCCLAWRFPRVVRTRRGHALPSGRCRETFSARHLGLSQVATIQGRDGGNSGTRGRPWGRGSSASPRSWPRPWWRVSARRAPVPGGRGGAEEKRPHPARGPRGGRGRALPGAAEGRATAVCARRRAHPQPPRVPAGRGGGRGIGRGRGGSARGEVKEKRLDAERGS